MADKNCSVDGCDGNVSARGLCNKHYRRILRATYPPCSISWCNRQSREGKLCTAHAHRKRRHGHPLRGGVYNGELLQFLEQAIQMSKDGHADCIIWPYGVDKDGYGQVTRNGDKWKAHRLALVLSGVKNEPDLFCCHAPIICHNASCVNPSHLRFDTPKANSNDRRIDKEFIAAQNSAP